MLNILLNTLPVFLAIALGLYFTRRKIFPENASDIVATIAYKIVGPFMIFSSLYGFKINSENIYLVIAPIVTIFVLFILSFLISNLLKLPPKQKGAVVLCMILSHSPTPDLKYQNLS